MIPIIPALTIGAMVVGFGAAAIQTYRLERCQEDALVFQTQVEALGEVAARRAREADEAAAKAKELSDAENAAAIRNLTATAVRLRKQLSAGGGLSGAAPAAGGPEIACYDRAGLAGALRGLDEGVLGLLEEGDKAVTDLNTAKRWAGRR